MERADRSIFIQELLLSSMSETLRISADGGLSMQSHSTSYLDSTNDADHDGGDLVEKCELQASDAATIEGDKKDDKNLNDRNENSNLYNDQKTSRLKAGEKNLSLPLEKADVSQGNMDNGIEFVTAAGANNSATEFTDVVVSSAQSNAEAMSSMATSSKPKDKVLSKTKSSQITVCDNTPTSSVSPSENR